MSVVQLLEVLREDVLSGAEALLGAELIRGGLRAKIVETEAYRAEDDPACHAYRSRTERNEVMFGEPGFAYVYFNYGVHWMLNVCAHESGRAAAVLIRAARPIEGLDEMRSRRANGRPRPVREPDLLSGPGKLTQAFGITGADNGLNLFDAASSLRLVPGTGSIRALTGVRIGIAAGKGHELPWRFIDAESKSWASRPLPKQ
jgi:DNA-3-methyladenine glycosylase